MSIEAVCACKGIRTCALCTQLKEAKITSPEAKTIKQYIFCQKCVGCISIDSPINIFDELNSLKCEYASTGKKCGEQLLNGVKIIENFINSEEENFLYNEMSKDKWVDSQSGRFKQDYGPKANFKKKKLKTSTFVGLPFYSKVFIKRLLSSDITEAKDFRPVELCNLKYDPVRGASIDPHFDDFWLWGPRLITLNIMSDSFLTMTPSPEIDIKDCEVYVPLRRRSVVFVAGDARYKWMHSIKTQHIIGIRVAITLRELTEEFQNGPDKELGKMLESVAMSFRGLSVGEIEEFKNEPIKDNFKNEEFYSKNVKEILDKVYLKYLAAINEIEKCEMNFFENLGKSVALWRRASDEVICSLYL